MNPASNYVIDEICGAVKIPVIWSLVLLTLGLLSLILPAKVLNLSIPGNRKSKAQLTYVGVVFCLFAPVLWYSAYDSYKMAISLRNNAAETCSIYSGRKAQGKTMVYYYNYLIDGQSYTGYRVHYKNKAELDAIPVTGNKFVVIYDKQHPEQSALDGHRRVPDCK